MTNKVEPSAAVFLAFREGIQSIKPLKLEEVIVEAEARAQRFVTENDPVMGKSSFFRRIEADQGTVYLVQDKVSDIAQVCVKPSNGPTKVSTYKNEKGQVKIDQSKEEIDGDSRSLILTDTQIKGDSTITTQTQYKAASANDVSKTVGKTERVVEKQVSNGYGSSDEFVRVPTSKERIIKLDQEPKAKSTWEKVKSWF